MSVEFKMTDSDMRKFLYSFIVISIIGWTMLAFFTFIIGFYFLIFNPLWLSTGIIGVIGIVIYIALPTRLRAFLEKRKKHEELKVLSTAGPIISLIGGIFTITLGYYYFESNFWGLGRQSIGIPFLIMGIICFIGVVICLISQILGNVINIIAGIPGLVYLFVVLGLPTVFILIGGLIGLISALKDRGARKIIKKKEP
jgi:MFS family permease